MAHAPTGIDQRPPGGKAAFAPPGARAGTGGAPGARTAAIATAVIVVVGVLARIAAARGELWLDEIWSLEFARGAPSALAVLTGFHHDNNHHLNTWYLMAIGDGAGALAARGLAIASAAALLALVALQRNRLERGHAAAWLALCAGSYVLVHYGSEARGYSTALALAVAAQGAMARWLETRRAGWVAAFAGLASVGPLAHLTFVFALGALELWAAVELVRTRAKRPVRAAELAWLAIPLATLLALWAVDLRHLVIGGGPPFDVTDVVRELLRATLGLPRGAWELLGLAAVAAAAAEVVRLARARPGEAAFFATVLLAPPAAAIASRPEFLAPRYFLVSVPFFLWLVAAALARAWQAGGMRRIVAGAAAVLLALGNAASIARLVRDGRGTYRAAVEEIVRGSSPQARTVGSDHDFRNPAVLGWYAREVPGAEALTYVPRGAWSPGAPTWVLRHDFEEAPHPEASFTGANGRGYALVRNWRTAGLSGWNWSLYRMVP